MRPYSSLQRRDRNPEVPLGFESRSDFPEETRAGPPDPHATKGTLSFPPQLHKNHEIFPSTQYEALLQCSVSQEIPCSLLELKRKLDTLYETPEASRDSHLHSRGMLSFLPKPRKSPVFPSSTRDVGQFPCLIWKGMPKSPSHLKRRPVST